MSISDNSKSYDYQRGLHHFSKDDRLAILGVLSKKHTDTQLIMNPKELKVLGANLKSETTDLEFVLEKSSTDTLKEQAYLDDTGKGGKGRYTKTNSETAAHMPCYHISGAATAGEIRDILGRKNVSITPDAQERTVFRTNLYTAEESNREDQKQMQEFLLARISALLSRRCQRMLAIAFKIQRNSRKN